MDEHFVQGVVGGVLNRHKNRTLDKKKIAVLSVEIAAVLERATQFTDVKKVQKAIDNPLSIEMWKGWDGVERPYDKEYLDYWTFASISSLLAVVVAVEIVKWSRVSTFNYNILKKVNFANYKFLIFVIIISALFNSIFTNLVLSTINGVNIGVEVIARFFIGDVLGSVTFIIFLMILFNLLQQRRLYKVHED